MAYPGGQRVPVAHFCLLCTPQDGIPFVLSYKQDVKTICAHIYGPPTRNLSGCCLRFVGNAARACCGVLQQLTSYGEG